MVSRAVLCGLTGSWHDPCSRIPAGVVPGEGSSEGRAVSTFTLVFHSFVDPKLKSSGELHRSRSVDLSEMGDEHLL